VEAVCATKGSGVTPARIGVGNGHISIYLLSYFYKIVIRTRRSYRLTYMKRDLLEKKYVIITCTYGDCNGRS
jgi:hypothetical protein